MIAATAAASILESLGQVKGQMQGIVGQMAEDRQARYQISERLETVVRALEVHKALHERDETEERETRVARENRLTRKAGIYGAALGGIPAFISIVLSHWTAVGGR